MINITQGIEGDDIGYHLSLLNLDINNISRDCYFFPLNNHYNLHTDAWLQQATQTAQAHKTVIFYDLVNTSDGDHRRFCKFITEFDHTNKIYLTVNQSSNLYLENVKIIAWDFMWNRIKAYYTESIPGNLFLHHYMQGKYQLNKLDFTSDRSKTFLSLTGREYGYRTKLYEFVKNYNGYVSNRSRGITLEQTTINGAFVPVPDKFYLDSYISIYVESNSLETDLIHITEKTFEPLLKGHIILPFSNPGTIQRLQNMGFQLPNFVDYSFDTIKDPEKRFQAVTEEFKRLIIQNLPKLYLKNKNIFIHNQQCINTIKYDNRILEIFNV
jgi:hypothetical protein